MARQAKRWRTVRHRTGIILAIAACVAVGYEGARAWWLYHDLERQVADKFSGRRWKLPSRVYSAPFTLRPGMDLSGVAFLERLGRLGYVETSGAVREPGDYRRRGGALDVVLRGGGAERPESLHARVELAQTFVLRLVDLESGNELPSLTLAPEPIAGIYSHVWKSRKLVKVAEVSSLLVQSVLAAEDRRFFAHEGVDWRAVLRALWVNVRAGGVRQGGSTLTQQLMKNFFLSTDRTLRRKAVELVMALIAERKYSKLEILENYLNEIYLGQAGARGIFGIGEAAKSYFGKEPDDLSLGQMALLAGMIQAPNRYSPYHAPERAKQRRNVVLGRMSRAGMITDADYLAAKNEVLQLRPYSPAPRSAPYFIDYVRGELADSFPARVLTQDGLQIYTTLDAQLQRNAEEAVETGLMALAARFPRLRARGDAAPLEAALVAIDARTGGVRAMVGGRRYGESQFNRVTQARRQVGSLFKPMVYAAAFEQGRADGRPWLPTTPVDDSRFEWEYDGQVWKPANYADEYFGVVTVRDALERSLNAATARIAHEVGLQAILSTARRLGFDGTLPAVPAIVLGAGEASPLQVARVYATIANAGLRPTPLAIQRVTTANGEVIEQRRVSVERAISPEVAFLVTHMLEGVIERGTGRSGKLGVPAAGKTGTTDGYRDAWFAGYTTNLVTVVWIGFDHGRAIGLPGSQAALPIWHSFMKMATAGLPVSRFSPPEGTVRLVRIDSATGGLATPSCPDVIEEAFPVESVPTAPCAVHSALGTPWKRPRSDASPQPEGGQEGAGWWPF